MLLAVMPLAIPSATGSDWPTYRHDSARSGATDEQLTPPLGLQWVYTARRPPSPAWPQPAKQDFWHRKTDLPALCTYDRAYHVVAVGDRVYFGTSTDDKLVCLDATTGRLLWTFFSEGPIRLAPTIDAGRVYFGSDDGYAYCLDAVDGRPLWKQRAAGTDRRIPGNGRMISIQPVRSGVLIVDGTARLTAGLFPKQGAFQLVLDAATGRELSREAITFSPQGYLEIRQGQLYVGTGRTPPKSFAKLQRRGAAKSASPDGPPAEYPYALIAAGDTRFAGGEGEVAAFRSGEHEPFWTAPVEGRAYSLAVADGHLLASTDCGKIYCFSAQRPNRSPSADTVAPPDEPFSYRDDATRKFYVSLAEQILGRTEVTRGYCLVLDAEHGQLVYELARRSRLRVIGLEDDADKVATARRGLDGAGLYGRAVMHHGTSERLPYGARLFNLIVSDATALSGTLPGSSSEILRVLRPEGGTVCLGQVVVRSANQRFVRGANNDYPIVRGANNDYRPLLDEEKFRAWLGTSSADRSWKITREGGFWATLRTGSLPGAGRWTHAYADPANTACSGDTRIGDRLVLQWFGNPGPRKMVDRHHRTFPPLYTEGRLFVPGNNHVFAIDAYNGTILWQRELADFRRIGATLDAGHMVAAADVLYLLTLDRCLALDVRSGEKVSSFKVPPAADGSPQHWGYAAVVGQSLFGSATMPGASQTGHSRAAINGTYYDGVPLPTSRSLLRLDRHTGQLAWKYQGSRGAIVNSTITIGDGRIYFIESDNRDTLTKGGGRSKLSDLFGRGARVLALDMTSGAIAWSKPIDLGALQHRVHGCYANGKLIVSGTRNQEGRVWYDLKAIDAKTGDAAWQQSMTNGRGAGGSHGEQEQHPVIVGNTVYLEPFAWRLDTGEPIAGWRLRRGGRGCGQVSASASTCYFRASNPAACDLTTGNATKVTTISRPGCWINMIPAGGLLLIPEASSGCTCAYPMQTSMAFSPAGSD